MGGRNMKFLLAIITAALIASYVFFNVSVKRPINEQVESYSSYNN